MSENIIREKTYQFALKVVLVCKELISHQEYVLSRQLLRSATSIGTNVRRYTGSKQSGFYSQIFIAQKEAFETHYWLRLLNDSGYMDKEYANLLLQDCEEIQKIITAILKTSKSNIK